MKDRNRQFQDVFDWISNPKSFQFRKLYTSQELLQMYTNTSTVKQISHMGFVRCLTKCSDILSKFKKVEVQPRQFRYIKFNKDEIFDAKSTRVSERRICPVAPSSPAAIRVVSPVVSPLVNNTTQAVHQEAVNNQAVPIQVTPQPVFKVPIQVTPKPAVQVPIQVTPQPVLMPQVATAQQLNERETVNTQLSDRWSLLKKSDSPVALSLFLGRERAEIWKKKIYS